MHNFNVALVDCSYMFWLPQSRHHQQKINFMLCKFRGKGGMRNSGSRRIWCQIIAKAFFIKINTSITVILF